jgi:hypothetical protein
MLTIYTRHAGDCDHRDDLLAPFPADVDAATEITNRSNQTIPSAKGSIQPQGHGIIRFQSSICKPLTIRGLGTALN